MSHLKERALIWQKAATNRKTFLRTASLSGSGDLTLTTSKSGYKSAVTVYDASFTPRFTFNSSDRYVADACLFADGKHLAAVTLGEADGAFASTLTIYSLTSEMPLATNTLTGSLVLSLQNLGGTVCALLLSANRGTVPILSL